MKTGMLAAEEIFQNADNLDGQELKGYESSVRSSWVATELRSSRNFKSGFSRGLWAGLLHGALTTWFTKGREPWTLAHSQRDCESTLPKDKFEPIVYPKHDGKLTFDLLTNL